jgi:hypothetical protein
MKALDALIGASIRSRPLVMAGAAALLVGGLWSARGAGGDARPAVAYKKNTRPPTQCVFF